ncbi:MAG TPA: sigma-70 family RNA polymerase sigma factor [Burkholderiales bacterium]|nr:sigma-70 family RNA polymerase sigma factor [Burkholderiales bacterium]
MQDPTGGARAGAAATLGDVLYANSGKTLVLEEEWVQLVRAVAAGDQRALHALYGRAHRLVFTLAVRITSDRETAEEVTLDVFHDVWRRAAGYDAANGTVIGWIMNQARSRAIDRLRLEQRKKRVNPYADCASPEAVGPDPHETLELGRLRDVLRDALLLLTPGERQAIETAYFSDLTHAEVAVRLDEPLGTVKTRIRSGLAKLRKVLAGGPDR